MAKNQNKSFLLGEEKINRLMLKFSLPCIMSLLVGSLYNIVDQIFIGNSELSTLGNAATGVVFPVFIIAQAFAWCLGDGCAAYLNICQGKNDYENAHKAIGASITVAALSGVLMMAVVYAFKAPILTLFGASENTVGLAAQYLDVVLLMMPVFILCNMMNSVIRADGSPAWAMLSMLLGAIVNIILDPVFIFGLHLGMTGAALATVIGQAATFVMTLVYFRNTKTFKLTKRSFKPELRSLKSIVCLGFSTFVTQLAIVVVAIISNVQLAKYGAMTKFGADIPIAIIGIQSKVFTIVINLVVGIVLGCQPIISFNMGAKKYDRVKELYKKIVLSALIIGASFTAIFQLAPELVIGMFGTPSNVPNPEDYWEFGIMTMKIFMSLISISCLIKVNSIFFQAVGKPVQAAVTSVVRELLCFVPLIIILPLVTGGVESILFAAPISDFIAMIVTATLSVSFIKSLQKTESTEAPSVSIMPSKKGVIVTVSRQHGTSGKQIGKILAEKLSIPFYCKEMTALAAEESGLSLEFIDDINIDSPAILQGLYHSTEVVQRAIAAQNAVIKKIANEGSCVIVGRAADHVLDGYENVINVFIHAPEEYRIKRIMESYGEDYDTARKDVRHSDEARASYYKSISGMVWGEAHNYHLVIDGQIGVEASADVIYSYVSSHSKSEIAH
ncbi:MAG: MATE family efflux transporter [Clostridia bacterium]|nr:MATE family efflux transporter [Clostridia bacterium]